MAERYKRNPNAQCAVCKKEVYRRPVDLKKSGGKAYCSLKCYGEASRKEVACVICSKPILASRHAITCSRSCSNKYRTGISYKIGRPRDRSNDIRMLKLQLIERRGKRCERCSFSKFQILQVHHKDRNTRNNELQNLELICPNCHASEHYFEKSWLNDRVG